MSQEQRQEPSLHKDKSVKGEGQGEMPAAVPEEASSNEFDQRLQALEDEKRKWKEDAEQSHDKYLRALAEVDNIRRRADKEKHEIRQFALDSLLKEMLPVLDSFDRALGENKELPLELEADARAGFKKGMEMVKKQLHEVLGKHGLESISAVGSKFDPNLHQAIQRVEEAGIEAEWVKEEYSKGYLLHGRLLRPALVSVRVPSEGAQASPS